MTSSSGFSDGKDDAGLYHAEVDGVIDTVEVSIEVEGADEKLAELIMSDLKSRADVLNQIVELGKHPDAATPPTRVDWEGWLMGEYDR